MTLGANTSNLGFVHSSSTRLQDWRKPDKEVKRSWLEDKGKEVQTAAEWNEEKKLYRRV